MADTDSTGTTLKTVDRALDVLEIVATSATAPQVRDVAAQLGHNLSSTYHIVNTLLARGYLGRTDRGGLVIGAQAGMLGAALARTGDLDAELRRVVADLASESGETVYLTRRIGDSVVIQMVVESQHSLRVTGLEVGYSGSEERRASGKAVLAFLDSSHLSRVLASTERGEPRSVDPARLTSELAQIRTTGYALDNEDYEVGVCCIAAPYFDADGRVSGSIAVSAPAQRVEHLRGGVLALLLDSAREVSLAVRRH